MPPPAEGFATRLVLGPALRTQPDRRLVALVREGYETAFEEIVRRYGRPLTRYAGSIVGSRAEDVTQDAFSKALLALRRSGTEIELRPWLFRIVRNAALNELRDSPPSAAALAEEIAGGGSPAEVLERREELADLMQRLQSLPDAQRAAIVMRELEGLSHDEIAAALGLSGGAARQAIFRARRALRNGLGMLLPLPLLKALLEGTSAAPVEAAVGAAGVGGGAAGAGVALKAIAATALVASAVGAGVTGHNGNHRTPSESTAQREATRTSDSASASALGATSGGDDGGQHGERSGPGSGNTGAAEPFDGNGSHRGGGPGTSGSSGAENRGSSGGGGDSHPGGSSPSSGGPSGSSGPGGGHTSEGGGLDGHSGPGPDSEPIDDSGAVPPPGEVTESSGSPSSGSGSSGDGSSGGSDGGGGPNSGRG